LLWQIENNHLDSTKLSKKVLKLDEKYKAPYEFMEIIKNLQNILALYRIKNLEIKYIK
jgi:hypothetical protein